MSPSSFFSWRTWEDFKTTRSTDPRFQKTGIYLLAHFCNVPDGPGRPDLKEVVYIGGTTKQKLKIN